MAGNTWDALTPQEKTPFVFTNTNIKDFFKAMPYRGPQDPAGQKLKEALADGDFRSRFNEALADPKVRARTAALPPDVMAQHVDKVIANPERLPALLDEVAPEQVKQVAPKQGAPGNNVHSSARNAFTTAAVDGHAAAASLSGSLSEMFSIQAAQPLLPLTPEGIMPVVQAMTPPPAVSAGTPEQNRQEKILASIAQAPGYAGFIERMEKNPELQNAMKTAMEGNGDPAASARMLENIQARVGQDQNFFHKINDMIDRSPQAAATFARELSQNPDAAFAKMDQGMRMQEMMQGIQNMFNGSGFDGLKNIFGEVGNHLSGIFGALGNVLMSVLGTITEKLQGISSSPRMIVSNQPGGGTPMANALDNMNGQKPQTLAYTQDGQKAPAPAAQTPAAPEQEKRLAGSVMTAPGPA